MPFFSQLDPAWKNDPLGPQGGTIGELGCVLTCVAMAFASVGIDTDPKRLNQHLNANKGYTKGSLLVWAVAMQVAAGRVKYCHTGTLESPQAILAGLQQAKLVIAKSNRFDPHWVYIRQETGGDSWADFQYFDPADTNKESHSVDDTLVRPGNATRVLKLLGTPAGDDCHG